MTRFSEQIGSAAKRLHEYAARDVTVITRERTGYDDRNNPITEDTEHSSTAEFIHPGSPKFNPKITGAETDIDLMAILIDDIPISAGNEEDTSYTTIVDDFGDGRRYRVINVHKETNTGKIRAFCKNID